MIKKAILYTLTITFLALGILTLTPDEFASKICGLGYYAHCSFTPISTVILIGAAIVIYLIARKVTGGKNP